MLIRLAALIGAIAMFMAACLPALALERVVSITYVSRAGDAAYAEKRRYTGQVLRQKHPVLDAVKMAVKESRIVGRAIGVKFDLLELPLVKDDSAAVRVRKHMAGTGSRIFVLDVGLDDLLSIAAEISRGEAILFNPRHRHESLRGADCHPDLFHVVPSEAMAMDGLAQLLRKHGWLRVLMLIGETDSDRRTATAFERSARKLGLQITGQREFVLSNDPRQRDRNNISLLTQGRYDAVYISDEAGEFGRYVPYQTALPRPVVGSHGLQATGWHWTWERHGAPQLNQRFRRQVKRDMTETDWAAWASVKSVVEAVSRTQSDDVRGIASYLRGEDFVLDSYKGNPATFRPWNNQLRQPILLHTYDAVIERAPLDGYLHQHNVLDTLGEDENESACRMDQR